MITKLYTFKHGMPALSRHCSASGGAARRAQLPSGLSARRPAPRRLQGPWGAAWATHGSRRQHAQRQQPRQVRSSMSVSSRVICVGCTCMNGQSRCHYGSLFGLPTASGQCVHRHASTYYSTELTIMRVILVTSPPKLAKRCLTHGAHPCWLVLPFRAENQMDRRHSAMLTSDSDDDGGVRPRPSAGGDASR